MEILMLLGLIAFIVVAIVVISCWVESGFAIGPQKKSKPFSEMTEHMRNTIDEQFYKNLYK